MEANIVKKIVIEKRYLPDHTPIYREAMHEQIQAYYQASKNGEFPNYPTTFNEITYERMSLLDPETKERKYFYVNVNERKLWEQLVAVSDGFINSKIDQGIQLFREEFYINQFPRISEAAWKHGVKDTWSKFRALPWYKRLFLKLYKPTDS